MLDPDQLMRKAEDSRFYLWLLNLALNRMVPFNRPHGFKVQEISKRHVRTSIPFRRSNLNHIKGLHATALATLSEFTTGLLLLNIFGAKKYRIILQRLDIEYHYQGKTGALANFRVDDPWLDRCVNEPLKVQESVVVPCKIHIDDIRGNRLTTATIYWQLKPWEKVKTAV